VERVTRSMSTQYVSTQYRPDSGYTEWPHPSSSSQAARTDDEQEHGQSRRVKPCKSRCRPQPAARRPPKPGARQFYL
jgi:hypothetical protein